MSANYVLVLVNRLAGASHLRGPSKTARRSGNRPALCRRLGVRPGQHRRERLGDLLVAGVVGMQTVGPTNPGSRQGRDLSGSYHGGVGPGPSWQQLTCGVAGARQEANSDVSLLCWGLGLPGGVVWSVAWP
jgi:hypothetical protein